MGDRQPCLKPRARIVNEIPPYAIWSVAGFVLTSLISGWCGYRWGLCSQKESEKLKARIDVLAIVDGIFADIPKDFEFWRLRSRTRDSLNEATFRFSCQLSDSRRLRIEKALNDYQSLDISYSLPPTEGKPDMQIIDKEHKAMLEALTHFRNEISDT